MDRSDAGRRRKIHILLLYHHANSFACCWRAQISLLDDSQIQKCIKDLGPLVQDLSQDDTAAGLMNYANKLKATMKVFCYSRRDRLRSNNSIFCITQAELETREAQYRVEMMLLGHFELPDLDSHIDSTPFVSRDVVVQKTVVMASTSAPAPDPRPTSGRFMLPSEVQKVVALNVEKPPRPSQTKKWEDRPPIVAIKEASTVPQDDYGSNASSISTESCVSPNSATSTAKRSRPRPGSAEESKKKAGIASAYSQQSIQKQRKSVFSMRASSGFVVKAQRNEVRKNSMAPEPLPRNMKDWELDKLREAQVKVRP